MKPLQADLSLQRSPLSTSSMSPPLLRIASATTSLHLFRGLPAGLLPCGCQLYNLEGYLSSFILLTCPNHCSCLLSTNSSIGSTLVFRLISSLLLAHLVTPAI